MESSIRVSQVSVVFCIWCIILGKYILHYLKVYDVLHLFFHKDRYISYHEHCADVRERKIVTNASYKLQNYIKLLFSPVMSWLWYPIMSALKGLEETKTLLHFEKRFWAVVGIFFSVMKSIGSCVRWMLLILTLGLLGLETNLCFSVAYLVGGFLVYFVF